MLDEIPGFIAQSYSWICPGIPGKTTANPVTGTVLTRNFYWQDGIEAFGQNLYTGSKAVVFGLASVIQSVQSFVFYGLKC